MRGPEPSLIDNGETLYIDCKGKDKCKSQSISCTVQLQLISNTANPSKCIIDCGDESACYYTDLYCFQSGNAECEIQCNGNVFLLCLFFVCFFFLFFLLLFFTLGTVTVSIQIQM